MPELDSQDGAYYYTPDGDLGDCYGPNFTARRVDGSRHILPVVTPMGRPRRACGVDGWRADDAVARGLDFGSVLVVVVDAQSGDITYSNEPTTVEEYYEFLTATGTVEDIEAGQRVPREQRTWLFVTASTARQTATSRTPTRCCRSSPVDARRVRGVDHPDSRAA